MSFFAEIREKLNHTSTQKILNGQSNPRKRANEYHIIWPSMTAQSPSNKNSVVPSQKQTGWLVGWDTGSERKPFYTSRLILDKAIETYVGEKAASSADGEGKLGIAMKKNESRSQPLTFHKVKIDQRSSCKMRT